MLTVVEGMSNTSDFILNKEDHTLGNLLAEHLKKHPKVMMCGYKGRFCPSHVLGIPFS